MGRISKALDKLRTKCTEAGVHPAGKSNADLLECIAEHFSVGDKSPVARFAKSDSEESEYYPETEEDLNRILSGESPIIELRIIGTDWVSTVAVISIENNFNLCPTFSHFGTKLIVHLYEWIDDDDENPIGIKEIEGKEITYDS